MKKMVMLFAAIAMAIGAQAETVMWQVFDSDAKGIYLVNGSNGSSDHYASGKWDAISDFLTSELLFDTWDTQLQVGQTGPLTAFTDFGEGAFGYFDANYDDTYFAFLATYDDANLTPGGSFNVYVANNTAHMNQFNLSEMTSSLIYSGNFGGEAIPEPTSGLLLLLGMAGLALKRSRLR